MAMFLSGHAGFAGDDGSTILPSMRRSPHLEDGFSESFQTPILYHSLRRMLSQYSTHSLGTSTVVARSIRPLRAVVREAMHLLTSRGLARNLSPLPIFHDRHLPHGSGLLSPNLRTFSAIMTTRDYLVSQLQAQGLWGWFLAKFSKRDGTWEHKHGYDTGWRFSDDPPAMWYQQDVLMDPHEYGTTDREFLASNDPDDQRIVGFMREIGFEEHTTRTDDKFLPEVWPRFVPIDSNHIAALLTQ